MQILPVWHRRGDCYNGSAVNRSHNMSHLFLGQMVCGRAFQDSPTMTGPKAEAIGNSALLLCKRWAPVSTAHGWGVGTASPPGVLVRQSEQ